MSILIFDLTMHCNREIQKVIWPDRDPTFKSDIFQGSSIVLTEGPSEKVLVMTMTSTFVSPPGLIGCDDVELGKPYNLTVLHSYDRTLLCYYP